METLSKLFRDLMYTSCGSGLLCFMSNYKDSIGTITGAIGAIAVISTFIFAIMQYRTAQIWKRNEFLAQKINEFYEDPDVKLIFSMLDYYGKEFSIDQDGIKLKFVIVHNQADRDLGADPQIEDIETALQFHGDAPEGITAIQEHVRNMFDVYCFYLQSFAVFIKNGLFKVSELDPYIRYHVDILNGNKNHSQGYHHSMFQYLVLYEQDWPLNLLSMFPQSELVQNSIKDAKERKIEIMAAQRS